MEKTEIGREKAESIKKNDLTICYLQETHFRLKDTNRPWLLWLSGLNKGCEPKGCWFNSQSGHMPGLRARSPLGAT